MAQLAYIRDRFDPFRYPFFVTCVTIVLIGTLFVYSSAKTIVTTADRYNAAVLLCKQRGGLGTLVPVSDAGPPGPHVAVRCSDEAGNQI